MRIACVHNAEWRNNGTATYWLAALKEMQADGSIEEVKHFNPRGTIEGKWDAYICCDDGRDDLKWLPPHPCVYYAIDTHLGYGYRLWKAKHFDRVYTAQKDAVVQFGRDGVKATWLPLACHPRAHPNRDELLALGCDDVEKEWDFAFVGYLQDNEEGQNSRVDYLDALFKAFPNSWLATNLFFEEMAQRFVKARVGFNVSIKRDLNMRVFEVMSTGTPLLTNEDVEGVNDLFEVGIHYWPYEGKEDMIDQAKQVMESSEEWRTEMADRAFKEVRAKHTYRHRMEVIVEELKNA